MPNNSSFDTLLYRINTLTRLIWAIVIGVFMLGFVYANTMNQLSDLTHENELRKAEIKALSDTNDKTFTEWRVWRENTTIQLARIEALIDSKDGGKHVK